MATQDDPPTKIGELPLTVFELPKWLIEPAVRSCRLFNTALDFIFYDVPTLRAALAERDAPMQARGEKPPSRIIDFDALSETAAAQNRWEFMLTVAPLPIPKGTGSPVNPIAMF